MRVAVISDVHGNEPALQAVLEDVDRAAPDEVWCLGDTVGYGAAPNRCCEIVEARADLALLGNHDLVALGGIDIDDFNDDARAAALWTRAVLEPRWREWLASLPSHGERAGVALFHASARDPVWEYVLSAQAAAASLDAVSAPVVLVGHSHIALSIAKHDGDLDGGLAPAGTERDLAQARWLLNPGSVGQPRDGDARAAWLLLDLAKKFASFRRVAYPVERAQAGIREAGLPRALADRLAAGI
jgi:diadenosine tetraphosphatase ApaH/serine/threonine PP2A family protein phosphatase